MLSPTNDLLNLAVSASDGAIGNVKDLYFDDETWAIRHLVVETGSWLSSRKVLISPIAAAGSDGHRHLHAEPKAGAARENAVCRFERRKVLRGAKRGGLRTDRSKGTS